GAATVNNNLTVTGNTTLASGTSKTLTVTGATTINNDLTATGNIVLATGGSKTLSVTGAASLSSTLSVTGNTTLATGSGSTLTVTGASTFSSDMTVSCGGGTNVRTLTFDNAATARILFKSSSNALNDWGYILFQNDSTFLNSIFDSSDSSAENARLSIGVRNDYANLAGSKPADAVDIQGSAQLTLNAGKWDTELDSLIGSQWSESGMGSTNGISFRIDNTERMRLNGTALTVGTDMTLSGARTLKFDNTTQSQILWTSANNYGSDSAFIVYLADSSQHGTNSENGRLSIGVYNDFGSTNADALDVQGGYKLKLNAGKWDSELNTVIGSTGIDSTNYGISLCVNDSEKMKIDSSGITVPSSVYVKGLSVVELKSGSHSFSSTGPWQSTAITVTFSRELWSAVPMVQGWYFAYNTRMYLKKAGAWIESVTVTGSSCNFTLRAMWEDDNYDDDWTATVYYAVVGVLKYTV
ncbi:MAG: hypothetical protein L6Q76_00120, partial [Polyangiaceae bacterium]|nr:hypothetical protein [Polyangiaceae bacterium]